MAEGAQRTYGMAGLLAVFGALVALGVVLLIAVGTPGGSTEVVPAPQTIPDGWERPGGGADESAAGPGRPTTGTAPDAPSAPVTSTTQPPGSAVFPDGSTAPRGVAEVLVEDGATSLVFDVPAEVDPQRWRPVVAPLSAFSSDGFQTLSIRVVCAESADEVLAQIVVTEAESAITVLAVSLVPPDGAPCTAGAAQRAVDVPLREPLGSRQLVVVPAGSPVPSPGTG